MKIKDLLILNLWLRKISTKSIDSTDCYCSHIEYLTHDQLRKLQLFHDIHASEPLPGINKHFPIF